MQGNDPEERATGEPATADGVDEAFFARAVDALSDGALAVDGTGTVVYANPALGEALGRSVETVVGRPLSAVLPGGPVAADDPAARLAAGGPVALDGAVFDVAVREDGRRRWLSASFSAVEFAGEAVAVGFVRDAAEREAELARYKRIIETVDDGIYVLDRNFTITEVNEEVVSLTGYGREELVGEHASLLAGEDLLERAADASLELHDSDREAATIVSEIVTKDGETVPIETRFSLYPFADDSYGQLGVVRDISDRVQSERTLRALHDSTRGLLAVESRPGVTRLVVDTAVAVLDLSGAAIYLVDPDATALCPSAVAGGGGGLDESLAALEPDGSLPWRVFVEGEQAIVDADAGDGPGTGTGLPIDAGLCVPLGDHGVFVAAVDDTAAIDADTETLVGLLAASAEEALSRLDREHEVRRRDDRLERQNRRLRRLDELNTMIREIDQTLVEAQSIDEIGDAVCERVVASERFAFAWVGEPTPADGTVEPRSWAGADPRYLDDVAPATGDADEPAATAAATGTATVVADVGAGLGGEPWRKAALARGFRSAIAVPLSHDDIAHGVLAVYATRPDAFAELEAVFAELGETIANAMSAADTRRALLTDTRTVLGFRVDADDDVLGWFARTVGGPVEVEGVVPQADGAVRVFFHAADAEPAATRAAAAASLVVESLDAVARRGDDSLYEAVVVGPTVLTAVADRGAAIRTARASAEAVRFEVELPDGADVRRFVSALRSRHPDAELVSKTASERPARTSTEFRAEFQRRLTDRQREVLRVAYLRGFYEWPRESTAQEVADALDVSQPTVSRHLRACQRKLLGLLLDRERPGGLYS
ncbi:bacterio-opsin activator domain-containing protein [Halobaculum lipolyticum]|uniref:Bacterio-opsin activator domain-containing protein n=1 Tax=Halobaculum lipolyticum TaxID=3032001 RepID=A0ABD5WAX4_9EURY|nr:bacterio-opsin activator domain-containing protein [Halobaculum sp. DT31]